jgi:acyl-CoA dehydrogenase
VNVGFPVAEADASAVTASAQLGSKHASLMSRAEAVAATAARHADDVDSKGRLPDEALATMRAQRLLGAMVPIQCGGDGESLAEVAEVCGLLASQCANSAMIYAMHQIQVASIADFCLDSSWHHSFLARIATEQLLLASATTEAEVGGNVRNSICAVVSQGDAFTLEKLGTVISYGLSSDAILVTARRHSDAVSSDQIIAVILREQYDLSPTSTWDTLGMRGTCSDGFSLSCKANLSQILPAPYSDVSAQSMLPTSHILWSSVWYGIASGAIMRAQSFLRAEARRAPNSSPPGALRLTQASSKLQLVRSNVIAALSMFEAAKKSRSDLSTMRFAIAMNHLKMSSSQAAVDIVIDALMVCGIRGYRNDTPYSLGRYLRDVISAPLMINNDRIQALTANMLLVQHEDGRLSR